MKKVITYGTYDLLHLGHINLLRRAKALGDYLIVGLSTDEFNRMKNKDKIEEIEKLIKEIVLEAIKYVDEVISEENWEQKISDIQKHEVDFFVMGGDWKGKFDDLNNFCKVVYLERTANISTTTLKENISNKIKEN